jgi:hypothetical protein
MFAASKGAEQIVWAPIAVGRIHAWATGYSTSSGAVQNYTWDALYSDIQSRLAAINAGGTGPRTVTTTYVDFSIYADGSVNNKGTISIFSRTVTIRGTGSIASIGSPPTSGTITYAQVLNNTRGWYIDGVEEAQ